MDGDNLVGGLRIVVRGKQEVDVEGEDWKFYVLQLVVSHSFNWLEFKDDEDRGYCIFVFVASGECFWFCCIK